MNTYHLTGDSDGTAYEYLGGSDLGVASCDPRGGGGGNSYLLLCTIFTEGNLFRGSK